MLEVRSFAEEHVDAAARLLQERHTRHRVAEPLLPGEPDFASDIRALLERGASGVVGERDGRVVGYLLGTRLSDEIWGPNVWVELAGHAVSDAEDVREIGRASCRER